MHWDTEVWFLSVDMAFDAFRRSYCSYRDGVTVRFQARLHKITGHKKKSYRVQLLHWKTQCMMDILSFICIYWVLHQLPALLICNILLYWFYLFYLKWPQKLVLGEYIPCENPENWGVLTRLAPTCGVLTPNQTTILHRVHSFIHLAYRIDSGTGTLHHVPPWTLALSQNSHRLTQSLLWWSLAPIPSRHPLVCHQRLGPGVVVVVLLLGPRPLDWQHCGWTG